MANDQEQTPEPPQAPVEKIPFTAEDCGLDLNLPDDLDIYTKSSGDLKLAVHYMAARTVEQRHNAGLIDDDSFRSQLRDLDSRIVKRRRALGLFE